MRNILVLKVGYGGRGEGGNEDYVLLKKADVLKDKQRLWKCSRLKEAKEPELFTLTEIF